MSWFLTGLSLAAMILLLLAARGFRREAHRLREENETLWEQIDQWTPWVQAYHDIMQQRARAAALQ